ncbi:EF-hand domain pair [Hyunsoonleella jejuensis]|uniref:EF-hand domain pair n=1 Tax=Hyunsoonleella jejuensis TaxID=419940 RepID=A0A1H9DWT1_9FLAO|nr:EF-hand domain-containing protein [Hyunsoonleella jejuensis]SEQ17914.1 EF-hand domain pair [Hyunsoonleella jejuensis]
MASKKTIIKKIQIVLTKHFESPQDAFNFFDKNGDGKLSKSEVVKLLKEAEINGFIRGLVGSKLIEGYDKDGDGKIDWKEFKTAVAEMAKDID